MVDLSVSPALGYMQIVADLSAATLLPIILNHIAPETTINSDEWRSYQQVSALPNVSGHRTVNHSLQIRAPVKFAM